jgi:hypothetical protein
MNIHNSFTDILFGIFRKLMETVNDDKTSQSDSDAIFTLSSAYISLGINLRLKNTGRCGICIETINGIELNKLKLENKKITPMPLV